MRKTTKFFKKSLYYTIMVLVCFEVSLWIIGYRPYSNHNYKVEAQPKNAFVGHQKLGIFANPGEYDIVLNDKVRFHTTHLPDGRRKVPKETAQEALSELAFLGCSFTYGYGVNDDETFVANLQNEFPNWKINNYATPGFGTVQSYLQLQELVKMDEVEAIVLCFSSFHFIRNVMSQEYRSNLKIGFRNSAADVDTRMADAYFPFIRDTSVTVEWQSWEDLYSNYKLRGYLASVNWWQNNVNKFKDRKLNAVKTTYALLQKMEKICQQNEIHFSIVCLDTSPETRELQKLWKQNNWLNVAFDFKNKDLTNLPYDSHPNPKGHKVIANKVKPYLHQILDRFD